MGRKHASASHVPLDHFVGETSQMNSGKFIVKKTKGYCTAIFTFYQ